MSAESGSGSADTLPSPTVQLTALAENMAIVKAKAKAAAATIAQDNAGAAAVTSSPGPEQPASSSCPHKPSQPVHVASDQPATFAFAKQPTMAGFTPAQRATLKVRAALQTQKHRRYGTGEHEAAILADATPGSILAVSQVAGRAASPDARHEDSGFAHGGREASSGSGRDSSGASGRAVGAPLHMLPPPPVKQSAPPKAQPSSQIAPGPAQYPKMPGPSSTPTAGTAASSGQPLAFNHVCRHITARAALGKRYQIGRSPVTCWCRIGPIRKVRLRPTATTKLRRRNQNLHGRCRIYFLVIDYKA